MKRHKLLIGFVVVLVIAGISVAFAGNNLHGMIFKKFNVVKSANPSVVQKNKVEVNINDFQPLLFNSDPTLILDNYVSLANIRNDLISIKAKENSTSMEVDGLAILKKFMNEAKYNPTDKNSNKATLVKSFFNKYTLPHFGDKLFIINVATGLYTEANAKAEWSLKDLTSEDIKSLFIPNDTINDGTDTENIGSNPEAIGRPPYPNLPNVSLQIFISEPSQVIEDSHFKQYNLALKLVNGAKTQREAVENIVIWAEKNFFHAYDYSAIGEGSFTWARYLDGRKVPEGQSIDSGNSFPLSIERIYEERIIGCQEPTFLLEGMFHNLNIPAVRLHVWFHGVLYLPTLNVYIHGDHIASYKFPKGFLLLTPDQFQHITEAEKYLYSLSASYQEKYPFPLNLIRKDPVGRGKYLSISTSYYPCVPATDRQWKSMTKDYSEFGLYYDTEACRIESKNMQIIKTLDQLND